jgi:Ring finger domain
MDDCSICYESISASTGHCTLGCAHTFHLACLSRWAQSTASCPLCRKELGDTEVIPKPLIISPYEPYIVQIDARSGLRIIHNESLIHIGDGIRVPERDIVEVSELAQVTRGSAILALRENYGNVAEAIYDLDHTDPIDEEEPIPPRNLLEPTDDMFTAWALERLFTKGTIVVRNSYRFGSVKDIEERQRVMILRNGYWVHPRFNDIVSPNRSKSF